MAKQSCPVCPTWGKCGGPQSHQAGARAPSRSPQSCSGTGLPRDRITVGRVRRHRLGSYATLCPFTWEVCILSSGQSVFPSRFLVFYSFNAQGADASWVLTMGVISRDAITSKGRPIPILPNTSLNSPSYLRNSNCTFFISGRCLGALRIAVQSSMPSAGTLGHQLRPHEGRRAGEGRLPGASLSQGLA